jgi:hypothetical protein
MGADMIRLFIGHDDREAVGTHVFLSSVMRHTTQPVAVTPLHLPMLTGYRESHEDGTNAFIYSRFLVPYLCDYQGWALFADGADMLCRGDLSELWEMRDHWKAVQVVKHDYMTKHPRKYVGTRMEAPNRSYHRKNWSSLMLINCAHYAWRKLNPTTIANATGEFLHGFEFMQDEVIGALPPEWNWLDEYGPNADAKLFHHTVGVPGFPHYKDAPHADEWFAELKHVTHATD